MKKPIVNLLLGVILIFAGAYLVGGIVIFKPLLSATLIITGSILIVRVIAGLFFI